MPQLKLRQQRSIYEKTTTFNWQLIKVRPEKVRTRKKKLKKEGRRERETDRQRERERERERERIKLAVWEQDGTTSKGAVEFRLDWSCPCA